MILTKEQILGADDLKRDTVPVPEWGEGAEVVIRTMTAGERQDYIAHAFSVNGTKLQPGETSAEAALVAMTVCDEDGALVFTVADAAALAKKNALVIGRIANAAAKLNGLGLGARKAIAKN